MGAVNNQQHLVPQAKELYETTDYPMTKIANIVGVHKTTIQDWVRVNKWVRGVPVEYTAPIILPAIPPKTGVIETKDNFEAGSKEIKALAANEPKTSQEVIELLHVDTTKWKLSTYWNKQQPNGTWLISALITQLQPKESITNNFIEFLSTYKPVAQVIARPAKLHDVDSLLIFNKQDAHLNKFDTLGDNDIQARFNGIKSKAHRILARAGVVNNISKIVYVLGSDIFDSEWTEMTTKGTPQKSLLPYQKSFELICGHEVDIISMLLMSAGEVEVIFIPGNHDQYVGWHLVHWLKTYFRGQPNLIIDTDPANSKYMRFTDSALMFNHGDGMKPERLAQVFPIEFKNEWTNCNNYYIFTGDKHHEKSRDIGGIRFYQIPALSKSVSAWDSKHGWNIAKSEMTAFLITQDAGLTDIYKEQI
jgi:hypothetical protein